MNINPVAANVKSYAACNNFPKKAGKGTFSSNPVCQTAQESPMQKLNINNVQSKFNISFRGEENPDSEPTQSQKLFDLLKQMDPDKANKAVDNARWKEISDCKTKLLKYKFYGQRICSYMSIFTMKRIAKCIPGELEEALLAQDISGNSLFHTDEACYENLDKVAQALPQVYNKALLLQNKKGETPVHIVSYYQPRAKEKMGLMADTAPYTFGKALTIQDKDGNTPLHILAERHSPKDMEKMLIMAERAPEEFGEAMLIKNNEGDTPIQIVISNQSRDKDCDKKIGLMSKYAPEKLGLSLLIQDKNGNNILHEDLSLKEMKIIQQTAPEKFEEALLVQNNDGKTPIHNFAQSPYYGDQLEMLAEKAPKGLGRAMTIQDKKGKTPLHYMNGKLVDIAAKAAPDDFSKAMLTKDYDGRTPLYYYTKNEDMDAILSVAENAPNAFYLASNAIYGNGKSIFETITEYCLKDEAIRKTLLNN